MTTGRLTSEALQAKRNRGERTGGAIPYGFKAGPDKIAANGKRTQTIVPHPAEQEVISVARDLRSAGQSLQSIVNILNQNGIKRRKGAAWDRAYLFTTLKRLA